MLHHVEIYVSDLKNSHLFWSKMLGKIGYKQTGRWDDGFTLSDGEDAYLTFVQAREKYSSPRYNRCVWA